MNRLLRRSTLACCLALPAAAALPAEASAQICGVQLPTWEESAATHDAHYYGRWGCNQELVNFFVHAYDMDEVDWNEGMGWYAPCDYRLPFARTINALYALHLSAPEPSFSSDDYAGPVLRWGGWHAMSQIDELDFTCKAGSNATHIVTLFDERTELHESFWNSGWDSDGYRQLGPVARAATILHEARHAAGYGHADSSCPAGGSCDSHWEYEGANRYAIIWLWQFHENGYGANDELRHHARELAQWYLLNRFNQQPPIGLIPLHHRQRSSSSSVAPSQFENEYWDGAFDYVTRDADDSVHMRTGYDAGVSSWTAMGGQLTHDPVVVSWGRGQSMVLGRGTDGAIWVKQKSHGNQPSSPESWQRLSGTVAGQVAAVSWGAGRVDIFARGWGGELLHRYYYQPDALAPYDHSRWGPTDWENLGGVMSHDPSVVSWGPERLDVVVRGVDGQAHLRSYAVGQWHPWRGLGGQLWGAPIGVAWAPGRLDLFAIAPAGNMIHKAWQERWFPSTTGWEDLGGEFDESIAATSWGDGRFDVFGVTDSFAVAHKAYTAGVGWYPSMTTWSTALGAPYGAAVEVDATSIAPRRLDVVVKSFFGTSHLARYDGTSDAAPSGWSPALGSWTNLGTP